MSVITYFNLNQTYILNSAFFFIIIFVGIIWLHLILHSKLMKDSDSLCDDKIAQFFNRQAADKCVLDKARKDTEWIENKYNKNVALMVDMADQKNVKIVDLLDKYRKRNEAAGIDVATGLYKKNQTIIELETTVSNIRKMYSDNEISISRLYNDYSEVLRNSARYIKTLADKISFKLSSNIYVKKKSYKSKRKSLSKSYDDLGKRLKTMVAIGVVDPSVGYLTPLTYLQRNGKK